jgi:hypothetical protein
MHNSGVSRRGNADAYPKAVILRCERSEPRRMSHPAVVLRDAAKTPLLRMRAMF